MLRPQEVVCQVIGKSAMVVAVLLLHTVHLSASDAEDHCVQLLTLGFFLQYTNSLPRLRAT